MPLPADTPATSYDVLSGVIYGVTARSVSCAVPGFDGLNSAMTLTRSVVADSSTIVATVASVDTSVDRLTTTAPHGLTVGTQVRFSTTGTLPGGLSAGPTYFVSFANTSSLALKTGPDDDEFATLVDLTTAGTGTHSIHVGQTAFFSEALAVPPGIYQLPLAFADLGGNVRRTLTVLFGRSALDTAEPLSRFIAQLLRDPTRRDVRVDLRTGAVGGYYFAGEAGLELLAGVATDLTFFFRDSGVVFVDDVSAIQLLVYPAGQLDAAPLLQQAIPATAVNYTGASGTTVGALVAGYGYTGTVNVASRTLDQLFRLVAATPTAAYTATAVLYYSRGGRKTRTRPFPLTFRL